MKGLSCMSILLSCLFLCGCTSAYSQHEAIAVEIAGQMGAVVEALESIHDPESARRAAQRIDQINKRLEELQVRSAKLPMLTLEENRRLEWKRKTELDKLSQRQNAPGGNLRSAGKNLNLVVESLQRVMETTQKFQRFSKSS